MIKELQENIKVSNQVGLWYNLQLSSEFLNKDLVNVSNQVGLWYNLQQYKQFYFIVLETGFKPSWIVV